MPSQSPAQYRNSSDESAENSRLSSQTSKFSPQQRTEILRNCHAKIKELENNINVNTPQYLEPIVIEADKINQDGTMDEKISNCQEVVLDSKIMCSASNIIKKCSANLLRDFSNYDSIEFADKIFRFMKRMPDTVTEESVEWSLLGKKIMRHFNRTAKFMMLLGTLRPIPKKEVVRRKTVREAQAPTKRPEKIVAADKVEDSVEETVNGIKKLIKCHEEYLDFFSLVLHPTSYGKTIENMLHTSFLIRDGYVKFRIGEDGIPYVKACRSEKDKNGKEKASKNGRNIQNVLSLNMIQWKALVQAYGIARPMIDLSSKKSKSTK